MLRSGEDRIAYVGERLTVKFAKVHPLHFAKSVGKLVSRRGVGEVVRNWNSYDADQYGSLKRLLLRGVVANQREARVANNYDNIVTPTVSLFGGIVNVQVTAGTPELSEREIVGSFADQLGPRVVKLGHMLENPANFGVMGDGSVRFVDGGSRGLEGLMMTHAREIESALTSIQMKLGSVAVNA